MAQTQRVFLEKEERPTSHCQMSRCQELFLDEFNEHPPCKAASFDVTVDLEKYPVTPERLVAAAWSIVGSRWFYKDEINFRLRLTRDSTHESLPVRVLTGPDMTVGGLLRQLETQIGPEKQATLCKENAPMHS